MKILKALNNNMVLVLDPSGKEMICQGKGIGFSKSKGDELDEAQIERCFIPATPIESRHFQELFSEIPDEYWTIAEKILDFARKECALKVKDMLLIPLCDHMAGSIERYQQGVHLSNPMLYDIQRVYPEEFKVGLYALELLKEQFGFEMKDDEAAFLAYHFVNAQLDRVDSISVDEYAKLINDIIEIVQGSFQIQLNTQDWNYQRFLTHLKFFATRILKRQVIEEEDDNPLYQQMKQTFPHIEHCVARIADYILIEHHYDMGKEERLYLLIHIERVIKRFRKTR